MWTLARRNLLGERVRLAVSVGGVAFAVLLVVLLRGVFVAYQSKIGDDYRGRPGRWGRRERCGQATGGWGHGGESSG